MKTKQHKPIKAVIERAKDGTFSIYTDKIDNGGRGDYFVSGTGATEQEAKDDFLAAYDAVRAAIRQQQGIEVPEVEFAFERDYISALQYYAQYFSLVGLSKLTGINQGQLSHYVNDTSNPTPRTKSRIARALAGFGEDLTTTFV